MPKNYSKCVIYKIICYNREIKDIYVGHTTNLKKTKYKFKKNCNTIVKNNYYKVYQYIRENGGFYNWSIDLIEYYPCKNLDEAKTRKRHWIEKLKASLNKYIPITQKEYYENNKEKIAKRIKEWRKSNKKKLAEKSKEYYKKIAEKGKEKITCVCGSYIRKSNIAIHNKSKKHQNYLFSLS